MTYEAQKEEIIAVQRLIDNRGWPFTSAFLKAANVTDDDLRKLYSGLPIDEEAHKRVAKVLRERLTHT